MIRPTIAFLASASMTLAACGSPPAEPATPTAAQPSATEPVTAATPTPAAAAPAATPAAPAASSSGAAASADVAGANFVKSNYHGMKDVYYGDISCKAAPDGLKKLEAIGGLGGLGAVASAFDDKEGELKKCMPAKTKARVTWTAAGGKMTKVKGVATDAKINKCVEAAIEGVATKLPDATCAATVWHD